MDVLLNHPPDNRVFLPAGHHDRDALLVGICGRLPNTRIKLTPSAGSRVQAYEVYDEIVEPIQAVAASLIPQAAAAIEHARHSAAKPDTRDQDLTKSISAQTETAARMKEILEHMVKSEGFQEAVNLLYEIQKAQTDVNEQTTKALQERIKRILEGGNAPRQ